MTTLPAMMGASELPSAAIAAPPPKIARIAQSTRLRPKRSPRRPVSTVSPAEETKNPVIIQATWLALLPVASCTCGITGTMVFCAVA